MNRPNKIRAIYRELRTALGNQATAIEILQTATKLVELSDAEEPGVLASIREQWPSFEELALDKAFADGGWRVLSLESNIINANFGGEEIDVRKKVRLNELGIAA